MVIKTRTIEPKIEKFKIENGSLGRSETPQNIQNLLCLSYI